MKHLLYLLVGLIAIATIVDARCGTKRVSYSNGRGKATCMKTNCDTEAGRSSYYFTEGSSTIYSFKVNAILFGDKNDANLVQSFDTIMDDFKTKYRSALGIDLTIGKTIVSDEYQSVLSNDTETHKAMATKYYKQGEMTLMLSAFEETSTLLGYANFPWDIDTNNLAGYFTIISRSTDTMSPGNTTIYHEVGHMLGLLHVFNEDDDCDVCIELPSSPDRNVVGDFCNDTLPMRNEPSCTTLKYSKNCKGEDFAPLEQLPVNNYMAYSTDTCQTLGFTPQQVARARCYLGTTLSSILTSTGAPQAGSTPSSTPKKASDATTVAGTFALSLTALAAVAF